jgi:hypothetical protein
LKVRFPQFGRNKTVRSLLAIAATAFATTASADPIAGYNVFELRSTVLDEGVRNVGHNPAVVAKLNENIESHCGGKISQWNSYRNPNEPRAVLIIEPHLTKLHFVGGNARFWLGPFKGNSDIFSDVKIVDAESGNVLAQESFRGHGNGFKGTVTIGATDNHMIVSVASDMCDYIVKSIAPNSRPVDAQAPASVDPVPGDAKGDLYAQLLKLDELRKRGILTEAEFQKEKQKLLEGAADSTVK